MRLARANYGGNGFPSGYHSSCSTFSMFLRLSFCLRQHVGLICGAGSGRTRVSCRQDLAVDERLGGKLTVPLLMFTDQARPPAARARSPRRAELKPFPRGRWPAKQELVREVIRKRRATTATTISQRRCRSKKAPPQAG